MIPGGFGFCGLDIIPYLMSLLAMPIGIFLLTRGLMPSQRKEGPGELLLGLFLLVWGVACWVG